MGKVVLENIDSYDVDMKNRFLTFLIGEESYGIGIENVREIISMQPVTEMPEMPVYFKGIINLRGSIIPAMDVRLRFKRPEADYTERTCIVVVNFNGISVGLIVDCVSDVLTIPDENIGKRPEINSKGSCGYVKSIGKIDDKIVLLLDCEKLMNEDDLETISA